MDRAAPLPLLLLTMGPDELQARLDRAVERAACARMSDGEIAGKLGISLRRWRRTVASDGELAAMGVPVPRRAGARPRCQWDLHKVEAHLRAKGWTAAGGRS